MTSISQAIERAYKYSPLEAAGKTLSLIGGSEAKEVSKANHFEEVLRQLDEIRAKSIFTGLRKRFSNYGLNISFVNFAEEYARSYFEDFRRNDNDLEKFARSAFANMIRRERRERRITMEEFSDANPVVLKQQRAY
jgi:hypothetical protein